MKNQKSESLKEKYLYDVVRRIPEKQRNDIEAELRTLIEDMVAEKLEESEKPEEICLEEVLRQLGDPRQLARSYRGEGSYLISGEYYDQYCYLLKWILICVGAAMLFSAFVSAIVQVVMLDIDTSRVIQEGISSGQFQTIFQAAFNEIDNIFIIPSVLLQIIAVLTIIYAVLERKQVKLEKVGEGWSLEELPEIPEKKEKIKRSEGLLGIIFGIIFLVIFVLAPQILGAWVMKEDQIYLVPLFNLREWGRLLPFFAVSLIAGIVDDFVKLIAGRYCYKVMITNIITGIISITSTAALLLILPVFNPNFTAEISSITGKLFQAKTDILTYFPSQQVNVLIMAGFTLIILLDIGVTVYYTVRYGGNRKFREES